MHCPVCGNKGNMIHKGTRDNPSVNVYQCDACGSKYLDRIIANDYEHGFMNGTIHMSDEEVRLRLEECEQDDSRRFLRMKNICEKKSVLDFGCGFGGFLSKVKDISSRCVGIELGLDERSYMEGIGLEVYSSIDELEEIDKFDNITLFHVFEHLDRPVEVLRKLHKHLKEDGKLIIEVPNANDALLSLYKSKAFADFTYWSAHLILYTPKSLTQIINEAGGYIIKSVEFVQRYPLSNHLYWLANGKPGGQNVWPELDNKELKDAYVHMLIDKEISDTLFFVLSKENTYI